MLVFGKGGTPVLAFPTSMGRFFDWENFGMVAALEAQLEGGHNELYCVDTVDAESFYNREVEGPERLRRHLQYESYLLEEVLPFLHGRNSNGFLIAAGTSLGAYHAANLAFRHPRRFGKIIALGGAFDLGRFLEGCTKAQLRSVNPPAYLPDLKDRARLEAMRNLDLRLAIGENDFCRGSTEALAALLADRQIPFLLDIWGDGADHEWTWWQAMIKKHII